MKFCTTPTTPSLVFMYFTSGLPAPDVVIYLSVTPEVAEQRGGYGEERYEKKEMQAKVRGDIRHLFSVKKHISI